MKWHEIVERTGACYETEADYRGRRGQDPNGVEEKEPNPTGPPHNWELFHCAYDGFGSEFEVGNFLNALIKLMKYGRVLETGMEQGHGTVAMAEAVKWNGFGHLYTVDNCRIAAQKGPLRVEQCELEDYVTHIRAESAEWARGYTGEPFDFAFFDCGLLSRQEAFRTLVDNGKLLRGAAFHDVDHHATKDDAIKYRDQIEALFQEYGQQYGGLFNQQSRGFRFIQLAP